MTAAAFPIGAAVLATDEEGHEVNGHIARVYDGAYGVTHTGPYGDVGTRSYPAEWVRLAPGVDSVSEVAGSNGNGDAAHVGPASGRESVQWHNNYQALVKKWETLRERNLSDSVMLATLRSMRDQQAGPKVSDSDIAELVSGRSVLAAYVSGNGAGPSRDMGDIMPALPEAARVDLELGAGACSWLDDFIQFARLVSPRGYEGFYQAVGLWALSTVAARRAVMVLGTKRTYTNLYIALCAFTSLYSKSTTARVGAGLIGAAGLDFLLAPNDATPAAFLSEMAGRLTSDYGELTPEAQAAERGRLAFAGQKGWFHEEFGTKLDAMMRDGSFMADWRGALRVFDDNQPVYEYRTMTRRDRIERPYLALLANMTPADLRRHALPGAALWSDGFLARFAVVTPPAGLAPSKGRFPEMPVSYPAGLVDPLKRWHDRLGLPAVTVTERQGKKGDHSYDVERGPLPAVVYQWGPGVFDRFYAYHDALLDLAHEQAQTGNADIVGSYARFAEKALRVAVLLAGVSGCDVVDMGHWARAQTIAESWRADLHNLIAQLDTRTGSEQARLEEQIVSVIGRLGGEATPAEIARHIRGKGSAEIAELCAGMAGAGSLRETGETHKGTRRYAQA